MWPVANGQSIAAHRPSGTAEASQRKSSSYAFSSGAMHWEDVRAARRVVTIGRRIKIGRRMTRRKKKDDNRALQNPG